MNKRALVPIAAIVGIELAISAAVLAAGFVAVSDDDFSRVVIAQGFVAHPKLDPSGSSWLPLPFLILGTVMSVFGRSLIVARLVAIAEGTAALLLLYRAAKNLELSDRAAIASVALGAALPTAARLGVSFQPEALTAGLIVFGASTLTRARDERVLGALALGAATLCRYEAWPAAVCFAISCGISAVRWTAAPAHAEKRKMAAAAALSVAPALVWMIHGALSHGSPVFFFHRVAGYRHALGETEPLLSSLFAYPRALFREPELVFAAAFAHAVLRRYDRARLSHFAKPAALPVAIFLFLVAGRLVGGAPTHHDERPLLPIFWFLAIFVAWFVFDSSRLAPLFNVRRTAALVASFAGLGVLLRVLHAPEAFASRTAELRIGEEARHRVGPTERVLVETGDYGYFAVIAAFGAPERAEPFDRHDPRDEPAADPFVSAGALRWKLADRSATWFVAPRDKAAAAGAAGSPAAESDRLVLFRIDSLR